MMTLQLGSNDDWEDIALILLKNGYTIKQTNNNEWKEITVYDKIDIIPITQGTAK